MTTMKSNIRCPLLSFWILYIDFSYYRCTADEILFVINARKSRQYRLARFGKVRGRLGLLPRLLECGKFYDVSHHA